MSESGLGETRIIILEINKVQAEIIGDWAKHAGFDSIEAMLLNLLDTIQITIDHPELLWRYLGRLP